MAKFGMATTWMSKTWMLDAPDAFLISPTELRTSRTELRASPTEHVLRHLDRDADGDASN